MNDGPGAQSGKRDQTVGSGVSVRLVSCDLCTGVLESRLPSMSVSTSGQVTMTERLDNCVGEKQG